jgi:hypothetical protein
MANDVVFRRIKGRIVPIKTKRKPVKRKQTGFNKKSLQAGAMIAGGIATTFFARKAGFKLLGKVKSLDKAIARSMEVGDFGAAEAAIDKGKKLLSFSQKTMVGGQVVGGAVISRGVNKMFESQGKPLKSDEAKIASQVSGQFAAASVRFGLKSSLLDGFKTIGKIVVKKKVKL